LKFLPVPCNAEPVTFDGGGVAEFMRDDIKQGPARIGRCLNAMLTPPEAVGTVIAAGNFRASI
jgi:hypothetical protein